MKTLICLAVTLAAADLAPFNGTWKFNPQKSKLEGETVIFKQGASGMVVQSSGPYEAKFRMDGKDYPTSIGYTVAWRETGKNSWESVTKLNGKQLFTSRTEISPDGKTLTLTSDGKKPDGEEMKEVVRYQRIAGEAGLMGSWRSEKVDTPADQMTITATASEMTLAFPSWQAQAAAKLDGKPHPVTGPTVPPEMTFAIRPVDSRTVEVETAIKGKPISKGRMQVSADGKTLTETSTPAGEKRTVVYVYEKQ